MEFRLSLVAALVAWSLSAATLWAQDPAAPAEPKTAEPAPAAAKQYPDLLKQWKDLRTQADKLIADYGKAKESDKNAIRKQFNELAQKAEALVPQLRAAALAQFEKGGKDKELFETLIGLAQEDLHRDRYQDALDLAEAVLKKGQEPKGIHNVIGQAAFALNQFDKAERHLEKASQAGALTRQGQTDLNNLADVRQHWQREKSLRAKETAADDNPIVKLQTTEGPITIELFENQAPNTVANFISLVEKGFYNGTPFHRVLPGFMAQGGDPKGDGSGGPGYHIRCECYEPEARYHFRGSLSMAHAGRDTGGSQFFLTFRPTPHLDGRHTVFGRVTDGLEVLAKLQRRDPSQAGQPEPDRIESAKVLRKRDHAYEPETLPDTEAKSP